MIHPRLFSPNPAWWELIRIHVRERWAFRFSMIVRGLMFAIGLYVTVAIWQSVYGGRDVVDGVSAHTLLVYLTIAAIGGWFLPQNAAWMIQERVLSGDIALDLVRPFAFLKQVMAQGIGMTLGSVPFLVIAIPIGLAIGSLDPPDAPHFLLYLVSFSLGFVVSILFDMHIGLLAFWFQQVNGIRAMFGVTIGLLSGTLVPLWLMPDSVRVVFQVLPFQAMGFLPASIYAGQVSGAKALQPLLIQVLWIGILLFTLRLMWKRAQNRIVIHGG